MKVSFKESIAQRGFHVHVKMCAKTPNTEQKLSAEKEKDPIASKIDLSSVTWKLKKKNDLILFVIRGIPREISRFVYFLWAMAYT